MTLTFQNVFFCVLAQRAIRMGGTCSGEYTGLGQVGEGVGAGGACERGSGGSVCVCELCLCACMCVECVYVVRC
jgi:hypothetical protein